MKTTILIITLITIQITFSFAGNVASANAGIGNDIVITGDKSVPDKTTGVQVDRAVPDFSIPDLAPVTPVEADFSDEAETSSIHLISLKPTTPAEADFE